MLDLKAGPIVMDFGLARREYREDSLRTRAGQQLGTPAYMPLEQFQGKVDAIGPRSDVYSLGVILFELLTGHRPYEGNSHEIYVKLLTTSPPAPSSIRLGLDTALDRICQKAMAREVEDRFASMGEFDQALKGITSQETGKESLSPWKRNVPVWVVALAGCLLVMFLGLFQWFRSPEGSRTAEDPQREARSPNAW